LQLVEILDNDVVSGHWSFSFTITASLLNLRHQR
jgi:hypothetical protein